MPTTNASTQPTRTCTSAGGTTCVPQHRRRRGGHARSVPRHRRADLGRQGRRKYLAFSFPAPRASHSGAGSCIHINANGGWVWHRAWRRARRWVYIEDEESAAARAAPTDVPEPNRAGRLRYVAFLPLLLMPALIVSQRSVVSAPALVVGDLTLCFTACQPGICPPHPPCWSFVFDRGGERSTCAEVDRLRR
jgi:hypothetical protein